MKIPPPATALDMTITGSLRKEGHFHANMLIVEFVWQTEVFNLIDVWLIVLLSNLYIVGGP